MLVGKVSSGLGSHRRSLEVSPSQLRPRGSRPCVTGKARWGVAWGLYKAKTKAEASFMRKHLVATQSEAELKTAGMLIGSEMDRRVEKSREEKLCHDLFTLAAAATSKPSGLHVGAVAARSPSAAGVPTAAAAPTAAPGDGRAHSGKPGEKRTVIREDATSGDAASSGGDGSGGGGSGGGGSGGGGSSVFSRAGVAPSAMPGASGERQSAMRGTGRGDSGDSPPVAAKASAAASSVSFLRRRAAARQERRERLTASRQGRASEHEVDDVVDDSMTLDDAQPRKGRAPSRRGDVARGFEALNARLDALSAASEATRHELSALTTMMWQQQQQQQRAQAGGDDGGSGLLRRGRDEPGAEGGPRFKELNSGLSC